MTFKLVLYVIVAGVAYVLFRAGRRTPTDDHTYGGYNLWFALVFGFLMLMLSRVWVVPNFIDAVDEGITYMALKVEENTAGGPPAAAAIVGLPTGNPGDYLEWVDHTHLQPKVGAPALPVGWRVAVTSDPLVAGIVIDKVTEVTYTDVWVFFDPNTSVLPGKSALGAVKLTITRP